MYMQKVIIVILSVSIQCICLLTNFKKFKLNCSSTGNMKDHWSFIAVYLNILGSGNCSEYDEQTFYGVIQVIDIYYIAT